MPRSKPLIFVSAGEVSGDIYGAELLTRVNQNRDCHLIGLGGPRMQAAGLIPLAQILTYSAVGLVENLETLPFFLNLFKRLKAWIRQARPDLVVLIDFQGLNLRLAAYAKELNIPVLYFIAPQEWLWRLGKGPERVAAKIDHLLAVFPPEAEVYAAAGAHVAYMGHPLLDLLPSPTPLPQAPLTLCLMPGSRRHEVRRLLPFLLALAEKFHQGLGVRVMLPLADSFLKLPPLPAWVEVLPSEARYQAMQSSHLVLGASGSMVLESVLLNRPVVAFYRVSPLTFLLARTLIRVKWITLPNILLNQSLVPEFIQTWSEQAAYAQAMDILTQPNSEWENAGERLRTLLGPPGAMDRAANYLLDCLQSKR